ncbi:polysaccharide biosynthesis tyrosine autokinase [Mucilaginibacter sp. CSA2-8R]|uniref:GumC family protein n=1 Tax=Mucilaginibacter sp. CSA2-8R TaxID=3141542 RepID=UPI00315CED45
MAELNNVNVAERDFSVENEQKFNVLEILHRALRYWYLFVICIALGVAGAIIIGKLTTAIWSITGQIIINDDSNNGMSSQGGGGQYSSILPVKNNSKNKLEIITSRTLISRVVRKTNFNIRILGDFKYKTAEIYNEAPFSVSVIYKNAYFPKQTYKVNVLNYEYFSIGPDTEKPTMKKTRWGDTVDLGYLRLALNKRPNFLTGTFKIEVKNEDEAIDDFYGDFSAMFTDKFSSSIGLTFNYTEPNKGRAILDTLMANFLTEDTQYKKRTADSTLRFIDARVNSVYRDLDAIQTKLSNFLQAHNMIEPATKADALTTSQNVYQNNADQQEIQIKLVEQMENILNSPETKVIPPSVTVNNGSVVSNIDTYNDLVNKRIALKQSLTDANPLVKSVDDQMKHTRAALLAGLASYKNSLNISRNQVQANETKVTKQIGAVPGVKKDYEDIMRQKASKEALYSFLLQRREEVAISNTSTVTDAQITQHALPNFTPIKPVKSKLLTMGLMLGLIFPTVFVAAKELLNKKVISKFDLESRTKIPIAGEIGHNDSDNALVITEGTRTMVSEQFRSLRTNLQYLISSDKSNVILVTSTMSGEGKTFMSLNLGNSLALAGKKVVILEFDLRKPKLSSSLGLEYTNGYTNFIITNSTDYQSIIKPLWTNPNCFLISSGPVPPNPTELLMSEKLDAMISYLKSEFDYVIIDTAPVGAVSDGLLVEKFTDVTLYVVRQNYTEKGQLSIVNDLAGIGKIRNPYLIINDIKSSYKGYGYGYNYGYGYDYGIEKKKSGFFSKLFS